jgi:quinol monooxygenase YgiN
MYAVVVSFQIKHHAIADFRAAVLENAVTSLASEPECRQFEVCANPERQDEIFLYELYTDRAAFDAHLASAHFKSFDALTELMIAAKDVRIYERLNQ